MRRQLISSAESVTANKQHTSPCSDCPWARDSLPSWLGGGSVSEWLQTAHGDAPEPCHVIRNQQCAGIAIYRANVCKKPRSPDALRLPPSPKVFATPMEFEAHHNRYGDQTNE